MKLRLGFWCLCGLLGCEAPPVFATADLRQSTQLGRIEGQVVVSSVGRGNVVVFLFDAQRPPPPNGTGRPLSFTVVPGSALFAGDSKGSSGPFIAPFSLSLVGAGSYLLRGFVDANDDFVPWYMVTSEVNAGDVGGGAAKTIQVLVDDAGVPQPALAVPVVFSDVNRVQVDRPAFQISGDQKVFVLSANSPTTLELRSAPLEQPFVSQPHPVFLAHLVDANGDGAPDLGADGRPLFWPRVVVRKVVQSEPLVDEIGVDYEHDGTADAVVLAAGFDFTALMPRLVDADGQVKAPVPVDRLTLAISPRAFDATVPSALKALRTMPSGHYAVTVIQETGQTWRVPNELSPGIAERLGFTAVAGQGVVLQVP